MSAGHTHRLVAEGLATWVAGSAGLVYRDLLPGLRRYVQSHPDLTLESIVKNPPLREGTLDVAYDGFAVLCEMVHDHGGVSAIRELTNAGIDSDSVLSVAARLLGIQRRDLDAAWRHRLQVLSP